MIMLGVGCGPQVGPFLSRPTMGSIRGEGTPPTNPSRHLKKVGHGRVQKWEEKREGKERERKRVEEEDEETRATETISLA